MSLPLLIEVKLLPPSIPPSLRLSVPGCQKRSSLPLGSLILSSWMMGPLTSTAFLSLSVCLTLLHTHTLQAKTLSAAHVGGRGLDGPGNVRRLRRDLRDALPYEAQMMSYPASADAKGRGGELYYRPDESKRPGLGQALQRLVESDQRRDQEAAYLAGLLRLLSEAEGREEEGPEEEEGPDEGPGDFQGSYPPDYDDTERGASVGKAQASWQGLMDPQLNQALLERYRQERMLQAGLQAGLQQELQVPDASRGSESHNREQEALRYLVAKILSSIGPSNQQSPPGRRARRDLVAVEGGVRASGPAHHRRSRRSLDDVAPPPPADRDAPLLRVKRLGDEDEEEEEAEGGGVAYAPLPRQGLQRMKRVDAQLHPGRERRRRSAVTYDPDVLVRQILQYLQE